MVLEGRQCWQEIVRDSKDKIGPVGATESAHVKHKTIRHRRTSSICSITISVRAHVEYSRIIPTEKIGHNEEWYLYRARKSSQEACARSSYDRPPFVSDL